MKDLDPKWPDTLAALQLLARTVVSLSAQFSVEYMMLMVIRETALRNLCPHIDVMLDLQRQHKFMAHTISHLSSSIHRGQSNSAPRDLSAPFPSRCHHRLCIASRSLCGRDGVLIGPVVHVTLSSDLCYYKMVMLLET